MRRKRVWVVALILLTWMLAACSGKTGIQKYKANIEKKEIYSQMQAIEEQKEKLLVALQGDFAPGLKNTLQEIKSSNETLKKSINQISTGKDVAVAGLHQYLIDYNSNSEIVVSKCEEMIGLYEELISSQEAKKLEEIYSSMVALSQEIDNYSIFAENSKTSWSEGLITLDAQQTK